MLPSHLQADVLTQVRMFVAGSMMPFVYRLEPAE